jgi:hypothetical protein
MSFTNGSLVVQGIQVDLPAIGSIKFGPYSIPFSDQFQSTSYAAGESATISIAAGYNGILIIPNNSQQEEMTVQFDIGATAANYISPEFPSLITFTSVHYPTEFTIHVSNVGGEQVQVVLF